MASFSLLFSSVCTATAISSADIPAAAFMVMGADIATLDELELEILLCGNSTGAAAFDISLITETVSPIFGGF